MIQKEKITVEVLISAYLKKVWACYTEPKHITQWNFATSTWHCPKAENNMQVGGMYKARMEAKDGSFGFDFEAIYMEIIDGKQFTYVFGGRTATVEFQELKNHTKVSIVFDSEQENSIERQRAGWQAILDNFKHYTESIAC